MCGAASAWAGHSPQGPTTTHGVFPLISCASCSGTPGPSELTIDNAPAEQTIRPLAVGRNNWLHLGGLRPSAVLLSVAASVRRHGVNPWDYFKHVLSEVPARIRGADLADLLPTPVRRGATDRQ
jgi:hypothetical protein